MLVTLRISQTYNVCAALKGSFTTETFCKLHHFRGKNVHKSNIIMDAHHFTVVRVQDLNIYLLK